MRNGHTSQKTSETQRQIMNAALHCFAEAGYAGSTLSDIRRKARVSVGSLYHWFASKEELGIALYIEGLRDYQNGLLTTLEGCPPAEKGIRGMVSHHLGWVEQHPEWARHLFTMRQAEFLSGAREQIRRMNRALFQAMDAWLRPHIANGTLDDLPMELFLAVVMGPSQEFVRLWLAGRARTEMKVAKRRLADGAWRAVRASQ